MNNPYRRPRTYNDWHKDRRFWAYLGSHRLDYDFFNRPLRRQDFLHESQRLKKLRYRQKKEYEYWVKNGSLPRVDRHGIY